MRISVFVQTLVVLALALLAAGCGGGEGDSEQSGDSRKVDSTRPADDERAGSDAVEADLEIVLTHVGDKSSGAGVPVPTGISCDKSTPATCRGSLECPATDTADDGICAWLAEVGADLFAPPPTDQICTEIYGGPEVATVTGTLDGKDVDATFTRTNGCEIGRFDAAAPLWTREVPMGGIDCTDDPAAGACLPDGAGGGGGQPPATSAMCVAEDPDKPVSKDNPPVPCEDTVVEPQPDIIVDPPEAFE